MDLSFIWAGLGTCTWTWLCYVFFFSFGAISVELECLHDLLGILFTFIIVSI